jgi:hypothetical protein
MWAQYCDLGVDGELWNSVYANLRLENNRQALELTDSRIVHLDQYIDEGAVANGVSSTIDSTYEIKMTAPYWEEATYTWDQPWMVVGGTVAVYNFILEAGRAGASGGILLEGVPPIKFDNVIGLWVRGFRTLSGLRNTLETTANTKHINEFSISPAGTWTSDTSKSVSPIFNYFPNPSFDVWLRGYKQTAGVRATFSQENTIVRRGNNAIRITCSANDNNNYLRFDLPDSVLNELKGKNCTFGAWVYVPDIPAYDDDTRTANPLILLHSYNGNTSDSSSGTLKTTKGQWNFLYDDFTIQTDCIQLGIWAYANYGSNTMVGDEYIVLDSVFICEGQNISPDRIMMGECIDSPLLPLFFNGRLIESDNAVPPGTGITYEVGDIVYNSDVAVGNTIGWICTTSGNPGTWKSMGIIEGNSPSFETRAEAIAAYIPTDYDVIKLLGYSTAGDGGESVYKKVGGTPANAWNFQSADGAYWELVPTDGKINVKQLGAVGDDLTDDTTAIQAAVDYAMNFDKKERPKVLLPHGVFQVGSNITIAQDAYDGIVIEGAGIEASTLKAANSNVTKVIESLAANGTTRHEGITLQSFQIDCNSLAEHGFYSLYASQGIYRDLRIVAPTVAGMEIDGSWSSVFDHVFVLNGVGDGMRLNLPNQVLISHCVFVGMSGIGLSLTNGSGTKIIGTDFEQCDAGGIYILGSSVSITGNYFELNANTGYNFTSPNTSIRADIIFNGAAGNTTVARAFPSSGTVTGNYTKSDYLECFVFAPGIDTLLVESNDSDSGSTPDVVRFFGRDTTSGSRTASYGAPQRLYIGDHAEFGKKLNIEPLSPDLIIRQDEGATSNASPLTTVVKGVRNDNLAETDLNTWTLSTGNSDWQRSSTTFPYNPKIPVWDQIKNDTASSGQYFQIDAADYPDYWDKLMLFGMWVYSPYNLDGGASLYVRSVTGTSSYEDIQDWRFKAFAFNMPNTGTYNFGTYIIGGANTSQYACPILVEYGADIQAMMGDFEQTEFKGTAAPTAGTWLQGDIVRNSSPQVEHQELG